MTLDFAVVSWHDIKSTGNKSKTIKQTTVHHRLNKLEYIKI